MMIQRNRSLLLLRDPNEGYKTLLVFAYALAADVVALKWMVELGETGVRILTDADHVDAVPPTWTAAAAALFVLKAAFAVVLAAHGRIMASYLVHEAAHESIYVTTKTSKVQQQQQRQQPPAAGWGITNLHPIFGTACLWLAGCPYCNFGHIQTMHIAHHRDRTDLVDFDYRSFVNNSRVVKAIFVALEACFVPAVETVMHVRQAFLPLLCPGTVSPGRTVSACVGTPAVLLLYMHLYSRGGWIAVSLHLLSGAIVLHLLAFSDGYQHTYDAVFPNEYIPGPGPRTAQYEETNTYSNVVSTSYPFWNAALTLNFGYHNAHHRRPMVPWYGLPAYHDKLYNSNSNNKKGTTTSGAGASGGEEERNKGGGGGVCDRDGGKNSSPPKEAHDHGDSKKTMTTTAPASPSSSSSSPQPDLASSTPRVLPMVDLLGPWYRHRLRRVVEDDYGVVHPAGTPNRAKDFVGALGVSFLTV